MAKFIPYDYNQNAMVVVNFQDQIQPGTFEYALHYLIEQKLDLSVRTVETHRINIKRKFDLDGTAALMKFAVERKRQRFS